MAPLYKQPFMFAFDDSLKTFMNFENWIFYCHEVSYYSKLSFAMPYLKIVIIKPELEQ